MEKQILDFSKMPVVQRLNAYYKQNTLFDILGTQRSETHHSAFIAWLLNPSASHNLQDRALRQFLAIAALNTEDCKCKRELRTHLLSGNYQLQVECIKTEQSIVGLAGINKADLAGIIEQDAKGEFKKDKLNRFDIWMLLHISFNSDQGQEQQWIVPVVIENKIYSKEGNSQTERYESALRILRTAF